MQYSLFKNYLNFKMTPEDEIKSVALVEPGVLYADCTPMKLASTIRYNSPHYLLKSVGRD